MSDDPERLLAEALRAQARNAPPTEGPAPRYAAPAPVDAPAPAPPVVETPGGYGLLSGAGEGSLERERAALDAQQTAVREPADSPHATGTHAVDRMLDRDRPVTLPWVLLLATALGLACGCVIGLLTVT